MEVVRTMSNTLVRGGMGVWSAVAKSSALPDGMIAYCGTKWVWRDIVYGVKGYMESIKCTKHRYLRNCQLHNFPLAVLSRGIFKGAKYLRKWFYPLVIATL